MGNVSAENGEKKELSPGVILGVIIAIVVVIGIAIFFFMKSDPAAQGPHPPPRFDPGAKNAESHSAPGGRPDPGARGPNDPPPGHAVAPGAPPPGPQ